MRKTRLFLFAIFGTLLASPFACTPDESTDAGPEADASAVDVQNDADVAAADVEFESDVTSADAGDNCEDLDPLLGSLVLGDAFEVLGSRTFDPLAALATSGGNTLFGVDFSGDIYDYASFDAEVERVLVGNVLPDVPAGDEFVSTHLSVIEGAPVGGFTAGFDAATGLFAGELAKLGDSPLRYNAPSNFDAVRYNDDVILSNGAGGLEVVANGVVGINLNTNTAFVVSTFDDAWLASSGYLALTSSGFGVFGGYYSPDATPATNRLRVAIPTALDAAVTLNQPIDMTTLPEFAAYGMLDVAAFGDSVAIFKGNFGEPALGIFAHTLSEENEQAVVGAEEAMLRIEDECTSIGALATDGDALLVTLTTGGVTQLLRIGRAE